mmetsp:Transcript_31936/g.39150  ORF Transcript_31936/g.39150 Transcript_31936/m.39150 type:complete len:118 (+) Transcript_31936:83-436(+)|eukprot:CAMPEP_0172491866 /NCGR_PEP_ID=MMETSP1066-20121228/22777_1 /TAXON_ID=671091 /ORGANISM="Coscinodiscus wailesii, Strain CCMP2513" /LENGTH=117 /DNA_ID=CAMNT_0013261133 /DNA_START=83 /DNA_END=436 /DNA_ORIENTATION=+
MAPTMNPGASSKNYNGELVKWISELRDKRDVVCQQIERDETDRTKLREEIATLTNRLNRIDDSLARKNQIRIDYDKTIQETEMAYKKIMESSHTLLHVLKREASNLEKKQQQQQQQT